MPFEWEPPDHWLRVTTIDVHTAGEPLRIIVEGYPELQGETILDKRRCAARHHDHLRRALMWEPRGHADMYGCVLTPPATADAHVGVIFLHNDGYSTMCGHGIIGLVKVGLEAGLIEGEGDPPVVRIDTPAGRVTASAEMEGKAVRSVSFLNVPSFVLELDLPVEVPGFGTVCCDIAYGGAFYAYLDAAELGIEIHPENVSRIVEVGRRIKAAVVAQYEVAHPEGSPEFGFLYGVILVGPASEEGVHSRNVCVFAEGEVDRSPTGTGVSGRAAILHARGRLSLGESIVIESLIGTRFRVEAAEETSLEGIAAIVPRVTGKAFITGRNEFLLSPDDPLRHGFFLR